MIDVTMSFDEDAKTVTLTATGPTSQYNRGAHAVANESLKLGREQYGWLLKKLMQGTRFDRLAGTYFTTATFSTAL